ncbi:MAG: hypothetical protein ABW217_12010 [Polyangiaceae bacterium]
MLSTGVLRAQSDAPPAADPPPPAAAPAEPPTTAAFPPVAEPAPAPAPQVEPAPAKASGNPKLRRLPNRNQSDAAPAAAPALTPGVAVAPVGGPGDAPGAYPGGATDPARDQGTSASSEGDDESGPGPFGVMFDVGVPDGIMLSGAYKPIKWARANLGLGYNGVSPGLRIGGALVPFGTGPFFSLDLGHYFGGDANGLVRTFASDHDSSAVLEDVGYDYMNLRIGAEIGGDRFKFIVRGGFTFIRSTIHHLDTLINEEADPGSSTTVTVGEDPTLTGVGPSLDLGLCVYL